MPRVANQVGPAFLPSGELVLLVSEPTARDRGALILRSKGQNIPQYRVLETPPKGTKIVSLQVINDGSTYDSEKVWISTPVLVKEVSVEKGPKPHHLRYLRDGLFPQILIDEKTGEVTVFFWKTVYSPIRSSVVQCSPRRPNLIGWSLRGRFWDYPSLTEGVYEEQILGPNFQNGLIAQVGTLNSTAVLIQRAVGSFQFETTSGDSLLKWNRVSVRLKLLVRDTPKALFQRLAISRFDGSENLSKDGPFEDEDQGASVSISIRVIAAGVNRPLLNAGMPFVNLPGGQIRSTYQSLQFEADIPEELRAGKITLEVSIIGSGNLKLVMFSGIEMFLNCSSKVGSFENIAYGDYPTNPIWFTADLLLREPHQQLYYDSVEDFRYPVGEMPRHATEDNSGVLNNFNWNNLLETGGGFNRFQPTTVAASYLAIPSTPGIVIRDRVSEKGANLTHQAIYGQMGSFTQERYGSQEETAKLSGVPTLFQARGSFEILDGEEASISEGFSDVEDFSKGLVLGIGSLTTARPFETYKGDNSLLVVTLGDFFPFGFVMNLPTVKLTFETGQVGHLFLSKGNTGEVKWFIRSSRISRPAQIPWTVPVGTNSTGNRPDYLGIYKFNEFGELNDNPGPIDGTEYGGLPEGMVLTTGGFLQGKPQELGDFVFRIYAVDSVGNAGEATAWIPVSSTDPVGFRPEETPTALRILGVKFPPIQSGTWKGTVAVAGGSKPYRFFVEGNYPTAGQAPTPLIDISSEGVVSHFIPEDRLPDYRGVWSFLIGVTDREGKIHKIGVSLMIRTTLVAGAPAESENSNSVRGTIPEGSYSGQITGRTFLVLEAPTPAVSEPLTHSIFLGNGPAFHLNLASAPRDSKVSPITTKSNGRMNPLKELGAQDEFIHSGMVLEDNPIMFSTDSFHQMYNRAVPLEIDEPAEGEEPPILEGGSIDFMTPQAIRIRPLWPL